MAKPAKRFESCCGGCAVLRPSKAAVRVLGGFKACPKRATQQFRSPIETAFGANREAPWQSQQNASRAAAEGCAVLRPSKAAARVLGGFKACPKRATQHFRSPIETAFAANREAPWQSQQNASRAAAEGCAVLRPSKAAARVLGGLKACPKRATRQFRSPIETAFGANREAP